MTYDATSRGGYWAEMTDADRDELAALEAKRAPSDWDRGALAAMALRASTSEDIARIDRLRQKWATR